MKVIIERWENDLAIRIPKFIVDETGLTDQSEIELLVRDGELVLTLLQSRRYALNNLLEGITENNRHEEWDIDADVGREILE